MPPRRSLVAKRPFQLDSETDEPRGKVPSRPARKVEFDEQVATSPTEASPSTSAQEASVATPTGAVVSSTTTTTTTTKSRYKTPESSRGSSPRPSQGNTPVKRRTPKIPLTTSPAAGLMNVCRSKKIHVYSPSQIEYERSVSSTNLLYRFTRPDCVVQPVNEEEVQTVVNLCREQGLSLTVRGGSHSYAGFATTEKGVLMDMYRMGGTWLDMENEVMYVQGGARWADVYKRIVNGRHNGYAPNGGALGYLMGAGLGPFTRSLGMGSDSVIAITVVTADGELWHVSEEHERRSKEGQLFWALRGAGGGNFGVVVQWKLRLGKLQDPRGLVTSGRYAWSYDARKPEPPPELAGCDCSEMNGVQPKLKKWHLDRMMSIMSSFYAYNWPDRITIDTTWVHQAGDGKGTEVRFITYCDGDADYFSHHIDAAVTDPGVGNQLKRRCMQEKSSRFLHETLAAVWNEESVRMIPTATQFRLYAGFGVDNEHSMYNMNEIILILKEELDRFGELFRGEDAECQVSFIHTGGAARRKSRCLTPYRWRRTNYQCYIQVIFGDKFLERCMRGFLSRFKARLKPHSVARQAVFVNFPDAALPEEAYERAYYGKNLFRLQQVKKLWDPEDFFHGPQTVRLPDDDEDVAVALARADVELAASGSEPEPEVPTTSACRDEDLTDRLPTLLWEKTMDMPVTEFQNSPPTSNQSYAQLSFPLQPRTRAKDIEFIFE
ncbi:hypothetical protein PG988_006766 [Apiospora saccharicola]